MTHSDNDKQANKNARVFINPKHSRSKTTGKFDTREELLERFAYLINERKMSLSSAARCCGVSRSTGCQIRDEELDTVLSTT